MIKHSNLVTPRSLAQAHFALDADPVERFSRDSRAAEWAVWAALVVGGVAAIVAALFS